MIESLDQLFPQSANDVFAAFNSQIPLEAFLVVAACMFAIGAWGAIIRRNAVVVFMCVELMINAVNLTLVAFSDFLPNAAGAGASYAVIVIAIAAAEVAVGLAIVLAVFRSTRTVNIDEVNTMKG